MRLIKKHVLLLCCIAIALSSLVTAILGNYMIRELQGRETAKAEAMKETINAYDWVIPLGRYENLCPSEDGTSILYNDGDQACTLIMNTKGQEIDKKSTVGPVSQGKGTISWDFPLGEGLYLYNCEEDDKGTVPTGAADSDGNIVVAPKFRDIYQFHDGYAAATTDKSERVIIDKEGNIAYNDGIARQEWGPRHIDGTTYLIKRKNSFLFDAKAQKPWDLDERLSSTVTYISPDGAGGYIASLYGMNSQGHMEDFALHIFLDENFQIVGDGQLYREIGELSEGLRYVERIKDRFVEDAASQNQKSWRTEKGYMNQDGDMVLPLDKDIISAFPFSEEKAIVYTDEEARAINTDGKTLFTISGDFRVQGDIIYSIEAGRFEDGLALMGVSRETYGIIDVEGNWVVKPNFPSITPMKDGVCIVNYNGQWGVINLKGGKSNVK